MSYLITVTEFATFRQISKKIDTEKANEAIGLAQKSDLYDILGDFYFDVLKNNAEATYTNLMTGSEFEYEGEEFKHDGIKALLADYSYARYIYLLNVNITPFGAQQKFTQDSTGIDRNVIKDISKQAQIDAGIKFKTIRKYLLSDTTTFSRYCESESTDTGFKIQRISKL